VDQADLNRATWSLDRSLAEFADLQGWTDPGESVALARVAASVRGRPVLDVGAGAGRLAPVLRLLSDDYVAVDYTPPMVELFRRNHPDLRVEQADARDLSRFPDERFGLVVFSFSGIDGMAHADRSVVLHELRRVLAPGGRLVFSSHNIDGPGARERPWHGIPFPGPRWYRVARFGLRLPIELPRVLRSWRNWLVNIRRQHEGGSWAVRVAGAHEFNLLVHYTSLDALLDEVAASGFTDVEVLDSERGQPVRVGDETGHIRWFHVVATK
jgi:SAM-dependent methyltransferase